MRINSKILSSKISKKQALSCIASGGLTRVIDFLERAAVEDIQLYFLIPSEISKAIMDINKISSKEFQRLRELVLMSESIRQKAALGILLRHANRRLVREFFDKELTPNYIRWDKFDNRIVCDAKGQKFKTKVFDVGPFAKVLYFTPKFKNFERPAGIDFELDDISHGVDSPRVVAGRFLFSAEQDPYGFLPKEDPGRPLFKGELCSLLENTSLPESEIDATFKNTGLFKELARLCFSNLSSRSSLYLTDIIEKDTVSRLTSGEHFADTLFGRAFIGAGFNYVNHSAMHYLEMSAQKTSYGVELIKR